MNKSHAGEGESPMGAKMLLLVLIALHLVAVALIVDGLRVGEPESGRPSQPWQVVDWNPASGCVSGQANDELSRYWSSDFRRLTAAASDQRDCVNIH